MRGKLFSSLLVLLAIVTLPGAALSQSTQQNWTLVVTNHSGEITAVQLDGRLFVDIESLARLTNGVIAFNGRRITLTLPRNAANRSAVPASVRQAIKPGFSKDFRKAGIESMTALREWRSALLRAVGTGYVATNDFVSRYQGEALTSLRLASVSISTDSDRDAYQLLSNLFDKMQALSNNLLTATKNMEYISPDTVTNDPLDQQILSCSRSLSAMSAMGRFQDEASCH